MRRWNSWTSIQSFACAALLTASQLAWGERLIPLTSLSERTVQVTKTGEHDFEVEWPMPENVLAFLIQVEGPSGTTPLITQLISPEGEKWIGEVKDTPVNLRIAAERGQNPIIVSQLSRNRVMFAQTGLGFHGAVVPNFVLDSFVPRGRYRAKFFVPNALNDAEIGQLSVRIFEKKWTASPDVMSIGEFFSLPDSLRAQMDVDAHVVASSLDQHRKMAEVARQMANHLNSRLSRTPLRVSVAVHERPDVERHGFLSRREAALRGTAALGLQDRVNLYLVDVDEDVLGFGIEGLALGLPGAMLPRRTTEARGVLVRAAGSTVVNGGETRAFARDVGQVSQTSLHELGHFFGLFHNCEGPIRDPLESPCVRDNLMAPNGFGYNLSPNQIKAWVKHPWIPLYKAEL